RPRSSARRTISMPGSASCTRSGKPPSSTSSAPSDLTTRTTTTCSSFTRCARAGDSNKWIRKDARMYFFLGEGEKQLRLGKTQEALTQFLQARQANLDSPIPLVKIGDMFRNLHDLGNATVNYKMAAERAPNAIEIWSKYMDVLIQSFEWDEAEKAMDRFRKLPVNQSAIDKAAGDMYA